MKCTNWYSLPGMTCYRIPWPQKGKLLFLFILLATICNVSMAQDGARIPVTGIVKDSAGAVVPNVTVSEKGTQNSVVTGTNGAFSISVASNKAVLVFTSIGFAAREVRIGSQTNIIVSLESANKDLGEVVVIGYGSRKKESLTGAISTVTSKDIEKVHGGATVSSGLAGKIPGVSFRMADGRPGASANIQIRNMGSPLFVIDGIQQDAGQFNNLAPNDIESITVLKDASAAIYGVRAANGVVVVTTKRGRTGTRNTVSVDAYTGWQTWTRFPRAENNSYDWMLGKAEAEMNQYGNTAITQAQLDKYKAGTEYGYKSFDWYDYIVQKNAPMSSINASATGGSDRINYYFSVTRFDQTSVLGREFTFGRTNIQSNVEAKIADGLKVGVQINGRIETRDQPGVPGPDDYWAPRFALLRNTPMDRPFANDNPLYLQDIRHNETNWGLLTKTKSGYWREDWRVLQTNFNAEYQIPFVKGLAARAQFSYYLADRVMNGHEYTYDAYSYDPGTDIYKVTASVTNPWRERGNRKVMRNIWQWQLNYNRTFGEHTIGATAVAEKQDFRNLEQYVHSVPKVNALPLIYFTTMDRYDDRDDREARIGYIGRVNYSYANKYIFEASVRRDASWKFAPDRRVGYFPYVSGAWRLSEEGFFGKLVGRNSVLSDLKFRASWGITGDDDIANLGPFAYLTGYEYNKGIVVFGGSPLIYSTNKGEPVKEISWYRSKITDIGADFSLFNNRLRGTVDYFYRLRSGLRGPKYDILLPEELGYGLPDENVRDEAQFGVEGSLAYSGKIGQVNYTVSGNGMIARGKYVKTYKPRWNNSWDHYRNSGDQSIDRYRDIQWGLIAIGQFQTQEEINNYPVDIDGKGNRDLLPGDIIYEDINKDGRIDGFDQRPIGYTTGGQPNVTFGFSIGLQYKGFDFTADFSGGGMYAWNQNWEQRWPFQNEGALNKQLTDRWRHENPFDLSSKWIPGKYPAYRFNNGGHSSYRNSTFWMHNVTYLRARTIELGYSIPKSILAKAKFQRARFYVNVYNLFSLDNLNKYGIDPEVIDDNGLQYPQSRFVNVGVNLSL
ncbi:TonB-dependent receptor [Paraflavitalea sp. CAU 1676]|uniref:SusC/RagA family TonB-linked outer membrane protein n=1 Tax=Paraflavitalea sp. CAU 1676 TaxID=3032598 RepID=UPI0023DC8A75|nr:TonB-dependent receptor [Paraflavitalea sp. CAU 1676]MDF2191837.1 TonB-dependent receptor [Paraflavitalea sp. CAU 1676]